ncbi:MAG: HlyD family efflux transporter periplasmic adaptor subunit [Phaeodactylibacter sp.]|nr:HlyD family efflux transporter periplasmic adaptor subunit [Phaeodactylibacter sp.]MCB9275983.1 HlyD family efflux transporter periplasmic adaptor subunit [Lewinellaceae bacterium]
MLENENIEIRSEEVQEILGTPPGWMTRYGTLIFLVALVVVGYIGFMVKYPDTVDSDVKISSTDPPKRLVTQFQGRVKMIRVKNESRVRKGEVLIVFDNTSNIGEADIGDVLTLENAVIAAGGPDDSTLLAFKVPDDLVLGELKNSLFEFYRRQDEYKYFLSNPYDKYSLEQLRRELRRLQNMVASDRERMNSINRQVEIVEGRLRREEGLSKENLLAEERVERTRESLNNLKRTRESVESSIKSKELDMDRIRGEMTGVRAGSRENQEEAASALRESFRALRRDLNAWKEKYVIISPIDGIVSLDLENISEQQFIEEGREIGVVVPLNERETKGVIQLGLAKSVKVKPGQKVVVQLDSYSVAEYGALLGAVQEKSQVPIDGKITVEVAFPKGLVTTLGRSIEPAQEMLGKATIITSDKRLIERVFENIRSAVSQEG